MSKIEAFANRLCGYGVFAIGLWVAYDIAAYVLS